jgi:hypothetical protein
MKERLLVLGKAAPEASQKYQELVCVAGITENGEWRRVYPIPWETFWKTSASKFKKKTWIEYELESGKPSDYRPESRKIKFDTITPLNEASYKEIEDLLRTRLETVESIESKGVKTQSLGVIEPKEIIDFLPSDNPHYIKLTTMGQQKDLYGKPAMKLEPPKFKYRYKFKDDIGGRVHELLCEDWEAAELYRHCEQNRIDGKYPDQETVHEKVKDKFLNKIIQKGHTYFVIGSHYRFPTYMIIGVVYPRKEDLIET